MNNRYTTEEKAQAFDALWDACGGGTGMLLDWATREVSRAAHEVTLIRVPRYRYEIIAEGEMTQFYDVLHHLATRKR